MSLAVYPLAVRGLTWPVMKSHEFDTIVQKAPNLYSTRIVQSQNPMWHWTLIYNYLKDNPLDIVPALSPYTDYRYLEGFLLKNQGEYGEFLFDDLSDDTIGMNPQMGGSVSFPSIFRTKTDYVAGTYVLDNGTTPHIQIVLTSGVSGTSFPIFNQAGGTTTSGTVRFQDAGIYPGLLAQTVPLITDGSFWYSPIQRNFGGQFLEDVTDLNTTNYPFVVYADGAVQTPGVAYTIQGPGLAIAGSSFQGLYIAWVGSGATAPVGPITLAGQFYFRTRFESDTQDIEQFMNQLWTVGGSSGKNGSGMLKVSSTRAAIV